VTREYPVFVPLGDEHIAAMITLPDGEPRGLAVLMTGIGAHRSHRHAIWTKASRILAERGIASARFDHLGLGESTSEKRAWTLGDVPIEPARAVTRFALRATGAKDLVAIGNCWGAWTSLLLGSEVPECRGVAFIRAPIVLVPTRGWRGLLTKRGRRLLARRLLRRNKHVQRLQLPEGVVAPKGGALPDLRPAVRTVLRRSRILFLFGRGEATFTAQAQRSLRLMIEDLSPEERARLETKIIPGRTLTGFESIETQEALIGSVVEFTTQILAPDAFPRPEPARITS
jgi:pimeloyl-ACP methyl ester carboxylesterase